MLLNLMQKYLAKLNYYCCTKSDIAYNHLSEDEI